MLSLEQGRLDSFGQGLYQFWNVADEQDLDREGKAGME